MSKLIVKKIRDEIDCWYKIWRPNNTFAIFKIYDLILRISSSLIIWSWDKFKNKNINQFKFRYEINITD